MNFSSYEELYDVFNNTAVFHKTTSTQGKIFIPKIQVDNIGLSRGDNVTIAIINEELDGGYVKFDGNVTKDNAVTVPQNISSNTNRGKEFREKLPALFICKKERNMPIPFNLSAYYNSYLLNRGLIFKASLAKEVRTGDNNYTYYRVRIPREHYDDTTKYSYLNSKYNCHYINLDKKYGKNIIKERKTEPVTVAYNTYAFTLPKEKALDSPFSEDDTIQVIAQRTKEMFNFPDRAK